MLCPMGTHIQRKRFDSIEMAVEQAHSINEPGFEIPFVNLSAHAVEDADGAWVVVTQSGELVSGDEPCLPDYERVA